MFVDDTVHALLAARRQVTVDEVGAAQALMAADPSALEFRESEASEPTHVDLVWNQTRRGVDLTVARKFDMRGLFIPVVGLGVLLTTIVSILAFMWFARSIPPLPFG